MRYVLLLAAVVVRATVGTSRISGVVQQERLGVGGLVAPEDSDGPVIAMVIDEPLRCQNIVEGMRWRYFGGISLRALEMRDGEQVRSSLNLDNSLTSSTGTMMQRTAL
jgi:hypothetical protein